ncbi:unnamed protein product [Sphagnum jensenii]|uniref:Uncharacterized protein n=1 Tax=Sphagnum jensenii TaxID=128206 RepID=A0ABP0VGJ1_9BRYO
MTEYVRLSYRIQLLEGWIESIYRIRNITKPNLQRPFNVGKKKQSYKMMNVAQISGTTATPQWLDVRGVSWLFFVAHPELRLQFSNWVIGVQRWVHDSTLLSTSTGLDFSRIDDPFQPSTRNGGNANSVYRTRWCMTPGNFHHVYWSQHVRKFPHNKEKCLWVFPSAELLTAYESNICASIKRMTKFIEERVSVTSVYPTTNAVLVVRHQNIGANEDDRASEREQMFPVAEATCYTTEGSSPLGKRFWPTT